MPLLEVADLTVDFGSRRALGGVGFALEAGERMAIVGEHGAGKTLLGLVLAGLLPPGARRSGTVAFDSKPLPDAERALAPLRGRRIAIAFADAELAFDPLGRIGEQLHATARRGRDAVSAAAFDQLVGGLGLDSSRLSAFPDELTPGERQLAMLAAALLPGPDLLIADEPGALLDPVARRRVLDQIALLAGRRKMALLLLTREPRLALLLAEQVIVLRDGRVADSGRVDAVLMRPRDEYTRTLVGAGRTRPRALMRSPIGAQLLEVRQLMRQGRRPTTGRHAVAPRPALAGVSFSIKSAEAVAIVGPAGAGKSTLANIIAGLDSADHGEIVFERLTYRGRDLPRAFRPEIALVAGNVSASFDPRQTALQVVMEPLRWLSTIEPEGRAARAIAALETAGLKRQVADHYSGELVPAEVLRLALARALVLRPRLLLLDVPLETLDLRPRVEMVGLIGRLRADLGLTLLMFSRDIELVRPIADRVLVLDHGAIVETGRPAELFQTPRHKVTEALLGARLPELG